MDQASARRFALALFGAVVYVQHVSAHEQPPLAGPHVTVVWGEPAVTSATSGLS
jgi:hypothetical protein